MDEVTIHEAKTHFSKLMARVEAGEEILVKRGQRPIGRIVPLNGAETVKPKRSVPAEEFWAMIARLPKCPEGADDGFAEAVREARRLGNELQEDPWDS